MARTYLYGVIDGAGQPVRDILGVDGAKPLYTIGADGLGCVVSDYQGQDFGDLPREALLHCLLAHQRAVEQVMQHHTVLPVKFGMLLDSPQEARDLLSQRRRDLLEALAAIKDKVEIEVAATWDAARVLRDLSQEEEIVQAREAISLKGQPTLEDRVRLGQIVRGRMDRRRDGYRDRMVAFLRPLALDTVANSLLSDEMVMNVAFLVQRARQRDFDVAVRELNNLFQNEVNFRVIGPLPPYSFSTVEVMRLSRQEVEEARQTLQLDALSEVSVRKAYRRLAAEQQRNLRPGDGLSTERFSRLRQASELLIRYCKGQDGSHQSGDGSRFLIVIRKAAGDEVEPARFGGPGEG